MRSLPSRRFFRARARETTTVEVGEGLEHANLFAVAEKLAARAATPSTRRQYAAIYRSFGDWLREQLGRPPTVADLDADAIAAYARFLETAGPRRRAGRARHATHLPLHAARARAGARAPRCRRRREGAAPQGRAAPDADRHRVREPAACPRPAFGPRQARLRAAACPRRLPAALRRAA